MKLLGFWAIENFPLLVKRFHGPNFEAPERVGLVLNGTLIDPEEVDSTVFRKLVLRFLQVEATPSTICKLKHFVEVPEMVPMVNEQQLSPRVKAFDIGHENMEDCWQALSLGSFVAISSSEVK